MGADPVSASIMAGGGILGNIMNAHSQSDINDRNATYAAQANREQMEFQERMSSTAHQREVADLQKAGINPTLGAGGSGASTPGGSNVVPALTAPQIDMPGIMNGVISLKQLDQAERRLQMDGAKNLIDNANTVSDTALKQAQRVLLNKGMPRAMLEGKLSDVLNNMIKWMNQSTGTKGSTIKNAMPGSGNTNFDTIYEGLGEKVPNMP